MPPRRTVPRTIDSKPFPFVTAFFDFPAATKAAGASTAHLSHYEQLQYGHFRATNTAAEHGQLIQYVNVFRQYWLSVDARTVVNAFSPLLPRSRLDHDRARVHGFREIVEGDAGMVKTHVQHYNALAAWYRCRMLTAIEAKDLNVYIDALNNHFKKPPPVILPPAAAAASSVSNPAAPPPSRQSAASTSTSTAAATTSSAIDKKRKAPTSTTSRRRGSSPSPSSTTRSNPSSTSSHPRAFTSSTSSTSATSSTPHPSTSTEPPSTLLEDLELKLELLEKQEKILRLRCEIRKRRREGRSLPPPLASTARVATPPQSARAREGASSATAAPSQQPSPPAEESLARPSAVEEGVRERDRKRIKQEEEDTVEDRKKMDRLLRRPIPVLDLSGEGD